MLWAISCKWTLCAPNICLSLVVSSPESSVIVVPNTSYSSSATNTASNTASSDILSTTTSGTSGAPTPVPAFTYWIFFVSLLGLFGLKLKRKEK